MNNHIDIEYHMTLYTIFSVVGKLVSNVEMRYSYIAIFLENLMLGYITLCMSTLASCPMGPILISGESSLNNDVDALQAYESCAIFMHE